MNRVSLAARQGLLPVVQPFSRGSHTARDKPSLPQSVRLCTSQHRKRQAQELDPASCGPTVLDRAFSHKSKGSLVSPSIGLAACRAACRDRGGEGPQRARPTTSGEAREPRAPFILRTGHWHHPHGFIRM
ncbi:hypothetical protein DPEC_G00214990 [Dallia pectoralis]|uniref:Uncharacterized protein n=1 Tax=Dallia pectoralis TaxID=75939 RepID=A0ACC2G250_DALPE|nr:hypothetical protein DPEC_G00214990 [Dallia pectoralis]